MVYSLLLYLRERLLCRGCASLLAVSPSIVRGRASAGQYLTVFCISGVDTHTPWFRICEDVNQCCIRADYLTISFQSPQFRGVNEMRMLQRNYPNPVKQNPKCWEQTSAAENWKRNLKSTSLSFFVVVRIRTVTLQRTKCGNMMLEMSL